MPRPPKSTQNATSSAAGPVTVRSGADRSLRSRAGSVSRSAIESGPDPAAAHARTLLARCGLTTQRVEAGSGSDAALDWARSGAMALTGERDQAPRFAAGPLATAARGAGQVLASLAPGTQLARLDAAALLGERAAIAGLERAGGVSAGGSARLLPTRDGVIVANLPRATDWALIPAWLESDAFAAKAPQWDRLARHLADRSSHALVERARLMGLAVADAPQRIDTRHPAFELQHASERVPDLPSRPLRLLDLSSLWAGPLAASLLAMAGIEVLKIESPDRPDGARQGPAAFFDLMNANKAGCALDLRSRSDRAIFERLLDDADIVLESSRPRALEQLGYDAAGWVGTQAGRLWISITGYGRDAPMREWIAYGDDAAIAAGLAWPASNPGATQPVAGLPCFCGDAIADPLTGLHAAAISLALLSAGRGGLLDVSLVGVTAWASMLSAGRLERPVERRTETDFVLDDEARIEVAAPRARAVTGTAPRLAHPNADLIEAWTTSVREVPSC